MFFKLKTILVFLILLGLMVFANNDNVDAKIRDYRKALSGILKVSPPTGGVEDAEGNYEETEKPDVEFSNDMKFLNMTLKTALSLPYIIITK